LAKLSEDNGENGAAERPLDARTWIGFAVLVFGTFLTLVNIQIVGSSYREIQGGLAAGPAQISWVLTASLTAEVIMIPLSAWLSRLMSTRWLFTWCLAGFSLASFACAMATSIESMIVARAAQGFCGGAMMPMAIAICYLAFPQRLQPVIIMAISVFGVSSIAVGPALGGWITDVLGWRWLFWISLPFSLPLMLIGNWAMRFDKAEWRLARRIDLSGIALAIVALATLLVVLEEGHRRDWLESDLIVGLSVVALISSYLFVWRQVTASDPLTDLRLFANRNFSIACVGIGAYGALFYLSIFILPLYLSTVRGADTVFIGVITAILGVTMVLSGGIAGVFLRFLPPRIVAAAGLGGFCLGTWLQGSLTAEWGLAELWLPQALRGFFSQLCWLALVTMALGTLPPDRVKNGSALFALVMRLGGAVGVAVINFAVIIRTRVHYAELAAATRAGRDAGAHALPTAESLFHSLHGVSPEASRAGIVLISEIAQREALIRAYNDVTLMAAVIGGATILLLPFVRTPVPGRTHSV
jgi:DHA2 family multidrug resistance protein|tara:strand:+ start:53 stop:1636 length:1584 start_codon:yes stop_codon:yes gene_type:complete